jgi:hypothetical protein
MPLEVVSDSTAAAWSALAVVVESTDEVTSPTALTKDARAVTLPEVDRFSTGVTEKLCEPFFSAETTSSVCSVSEKFPTQDMQVTLEFVVRFSVGAIFDGLALPTLSCVAMLSTTIMLRGDVAVAVSE